MNDGERLAVLENQMNNIEKKVDDGFKNVMKRLDDLDQKYASKWVETALSWGLYSVIGAVLLALVAFLVRGGLK